MKNGKKNRQTLFMYYVQQSVLGFDEFFQTLFKSMKRTAKKIFKPGICVHCGESLRWFL